jgi:hypothetical protein
LKNLILSYLFIVFSLVSCGVDDADSANSDISSYYLKYESNTKITGTISFSLDNITTGHSIKLDSFMVNIEGCAVDPIATKISPDSLNFLNISPLGTLVLDIELSQECSNQNIELVAKYTDTNILDGKLLTYTEDRSYALNVEKTDDGDGGNDGKSQIMFQTDDGESKMSLNEKKGFSVTIYNEDKKEVDPLDIESISISLDNGSMAVLVDSNDKESTKYEFSHQNNISLTLKSYTISGLVPIHVSAIYKETSSNTKSINNTFNIIVESGPPTSISISYTSTDQDKDRGKFIENFSISVTDKYSNKVNTNPEVSVGAIVGYANYDNGVNHRIFINSRSDILGTLSSEGLDLNRNLIATTNNIDLSNDVLVTFGDDYKYSASGKWDIGSYTSNFISLLPNQYNGAKTSDLGYAIGRNHRQDQCVLGDEWIGQAKLKDGVTNIDEYGSAIVELYYDYYLTGKDILLYVNIIGKDNTLDKIMKIGEAKKHTLRGHGVEVKTTSNMIADDGSELTKRFYAWVRDTPVAYRNARFAFANVDATGDGNIKSFNRMAIESCDSQGHAYVEYTIKADTNKSFSINLSDPYILNEF